MVQDQVLHKCNTSKNKKTKKEPQRGLGVAQLERLRLEEQRKANALSSASSSAISFHNSFPSLQLLPSHNPPVAQPFLHQASPSTIWQCHNFSNWRHQLPLPQASVPLVGLLLSFLFVFIFLRCVCVSVSYVFIYMMSTFL
jgi:Plant transcription factor NOZZLE